jgi:hypothetical protein
MVSDNFCRTCSCISHFLVALVMLAFAILGACAELCRAADYDAASVILHYELDTSRLPPKTKVDM